MTREERLEKWGWKKYLEELNDCPFCGSKVAMWEYDTRDRENDVQGYAIRHRIEYVDCYLAGKVPSIVYYNPDILKMAWNNRAYQYLKE